jgi:hypothetical protein
MAVDRLLEHRLAALEHLEPLAGDHRVGGAAVVRRDHALDQARLLQPSDQARRPAAREQKGVGQLTHAYAPLVLHADVHQHLDRRERQSDRLLELPIDAVKAAHRGLQVAVPRLELRVLVLRVLPHDKQL